MSRIFCPYELLIVLTVIKIISITVVKASAPIDSAGIPCKQFLPLAKSGFNRFHFFAEHRMEAMPEPLRFSPPDHWNAFPEDVF
jgi:hypothetical protein